MNRIAVLTSGGDAPGMNAAIRSVVRCGIDKGLEVYGIQRGYSGLIDGEIEELYRGSVGDIMQRGGTILKTARSERFLTEQGLNHAAAVLDTFGIDGLVVVGGDGTLKGARDLSRLGVKIMGLPGTIDNDLAYTDYTIGFDTAVGTVLDAISKVRDTSSSHERTTVIEVMGRSCGDIALYSGLCGGAEIVLIPEKSFDINSICKKIIISANKGKLHNIIIKAEGAKINSHELVEEIEKRTGKEVRLVVLSYLQRGGVPTMRDRLLATKCGAKAVELLAEDSDSKAIGIVDNNIVAFDLEDALNMKREFNQDIYDLIDILSK